MRASSGQYYVALDHLRGLAAFLVFTWHFIHGTEQPGSPVRFDYTPNLFLLAPLEAGFCGVALFMCLSGYLFAKLLDGKEINYLGFLWNRFIRLAPLLAFSMTIYGLLHVQSNPSGYIEYIGGLAKGLVLPTLPNGGWSVTAELHFYIVLPLILFMTRRNIWLLGLILLSALAVRVAIYEAVGQVQWVAYWTIIGRIDQFVLGVAAYNLRSYLARKHVAMAAGFVTFSAFYWCFDLAGGFYNLPSYPSPSPLWIVMPTIEGVFFSALIAYCDTSFSFPQRGWSGIFARVGTYSYSIYLLHFYVVWWMSHRFFNLFHTTNFYLCSLGALVAFVPIVIVSGISFHLIERPFLRLRVPYSQPRKSPTMVQFLHPGMDVL